MFLDESVELKYRDEKLQTFYYSQMSDNSWQAGNDQCQAMGGHLPIIRTPGFNSTFQSKVPKS
jgi:hypothetical protein